MTDSSKEYTLNGYTIQAEDLPEDLQEIAEQIGLEALLRLIELRGGESVYFPRQESITRRARNRAILDEFNGDNHHHLARKYGCSLAWVYVLISKGRRAGKSHVDNQQQLSLF